MRMKLGTAKRAPITPALVDTGASISVLLRDLARDIFKSEGRPFLLARTMAKVTSATGHSLGIMGTLEVKVSGVGVISFHVMKEPTNHQCIIGWDMLQKHGFQIDSSNLLWGQQVFPYQKFTSHAVAPIDPSNQSALDKLLAKYKDVFGEPGTLKQAKVPPLEIITTGPPRNQRPYRTPLSKRADIEEEIKKMLALGVIRPSASPWASPVTLVPKKTGDLRFCIDYRFSLNNVTVKNRYPLPHIQDIFDQLKGATVFSTLDCRSGYWQVGVAPDSIPKTAFICHAGHFEFVRMPFGLCNAPAHYQSIMNQVLTKHIGVRCCVFLDDLVVYSKDAESHLKDLEMVLSDLQDHNLKAISH